MSDITKFLQKLSFENTKDRLYIERIVRMFVDNDFNQFYVKISKQLRRDESSVRKRITRIKENMDEDILKKQLGISDIPANKKFIQLVTLKSGESHSDKN